MGSQVTASCECGLEATIGIGGGRLNFTTVCSFPCLCEQCRDVVEVNLLAEPMECPECRNPNVVPYDDPRLSEGKGEKTEASWHMREELGRALILTNTKYLCPQCGQMTLRFIDSGLCWD